MLQARGRAIAAALAAAIGASARPPARRAPIPQSDYATGYELGSQAYEYGIPLLDTDRIFRTATSVSKPDTKGHAPVNRFSHARKLADPDGPRRRRPQPRHALLDRLARSLARAARSSQMPPKMHRFFAFELVSPWTENFAQHRHGHRPARRAATSRSSGPTSTASCRRASTKVRSPYDRVWMIGRTYIKDASDTKRVNRIQDAYGLVPLSQVRQATTSRSTTAERHDGRHGDDPGPRARGRPARLLHGAERPDEASSRRPPPTSRCSTSSRRSASARAPTRRRPALSADTLQRHARRGHAGPGEHPGEARRPLRRPVRRRTTATCSATSATTGPTTSCGRSPTRSASAR